MDIKTAIQNVVAGKDLAERDMRSVFNVIMDGKAAPSQIGAFLTALRMKGETVEELSGAVKVMRAKAVAIKVPGTVLDTCGTGGSGIDTFNISTAAAFAVSACGVRVAKHGNRSASSMCGSADVLEALGVNIDVPAALTQQCVRKIGIGFMFAPLFHSAMKYCVGPRKEIGIRTIFNMIGPLSNPASASCQVMGVYDSALTPVMAKVLKRIGVKRAYVVCGEDGLDEVSLSAATSISELRNGKIRTFRVKPSDFGMKKTPLRSISGGTAAQNAGAIRDVLSGRKGPRRDIVLVNAALGLMAAGKAAGYVEGVKMAAEALDSGKAMEKLLLLRDMTAKRKGR